MDIGKNTKGYVDVKKQDMPSHSNSVSWRDNTSSFHSNSVKNGNHADDVKSNTSCITCGEVFGSYAALEKHTGIVGHGFAGTWAYRCFRCEKRFTQSQHHIDHLDKHHKYHCHLCPASEFHYITSKPYRDHLRVFHRFSSSSLTCLTTSMALVVRKPCAVCGRQFSKHSELLSHLKSTGHGFPISCDKCMAMIASYEIYNYHRSVHHYEQGSIFRCNLCGCRYRGRYELLNHITLHDSPYQCSQCTMSSVHYQIMFEHVAKHNSAINYENPSAMHYPYPEHADLYHSNVEPANKKTEPQNHDITNYHAGCHETSDDKGLKISQDISLINTQTQSFVTKKVDAYRICPGGRISKVHLDGSTFNQPYDRIPVMGTEACSPISDKAPSVPVPPTTSINDSGFHDDTYLDNYLGITLDDESPLANLLDFPNSEGQDFMAITPNNIFHPEAPSSVNLSPRNFTHSNEQSTKTKIGAVAGRHIHLSMRSASNNTFSVSASGVSTSFCKLSDRMKTVTTEKTSHHSKYKTSFIRVKFPASNFVPVQRSLLKSSSEFCRSSGESTISATNLTRRSGSLLKQLLEPLNVSGETNLSHQSEDSCQNKTTSKSRPHAPTQDGKQHLESLIGPGYTDIGVINTSPEAKNSIPTSLRSTASTSKPVEVTAAASETKLSYKAGDDYETSEGTEDDDIIVVIDSDQEGHDPNDSLVYNYDYDSWTNSVHELLDTNSQHNTDDSKDSHKSPTFDPDSDASIPIETVEKTLNLTHCGFHTACKSANACDDNKSDDHTKEKTSEESAVENDGPTQHHLGKDTDCTPTGTRCTDDSLSESQILMSTSSEVMVPAGEIQTLHSKESGHDVLSAQTTEKRDQTSPQIQSSKKRAVGSNENMCGKCSPCRLYICEICRADNTFGDKSQFYEHIARHSEGNLIRCKVKSEYFDSYKSEDFTPPGVAIVLSRPNRDYIITHKKSFIYKIKDPTYSVAESVVGPIRILPDSPSQTDLQNTGTEKTSSTNHQKVDRDESEKSTPANRQEADCDQSEDNSSAKRQAFHCDPSEDISSAKRQKGNCDQSEETPPAKRLTVDDVSRPSNANFRPSYTPRANAKFELDPNNNFTESQTDTPHMSPMFSDSDDSRDEDELKSVLNSLVDGVVCEREAIDSRKPCDNPVDLSNVIRIEPLSSDAQHSGLGEPYEIEPDGTIIIWEKHYFIINFLFRSSIALSDSKVYAINVRLIWESLGQLPFVVKAWSRKIEY